MCTKMIYIGAAMAALSLPAATFAHHSFAMFDIQKTMVIDGTVKEFQWTNPHVWLQVMVKDPATGKEVEWSIEGGSSNALGRKGWKRTSIKAGDKVSVTIHPLKDGSYGGSLNAVVVNGAPLSNERP